MIAVLLVAGCAPAAQVPPAQSVTSTPVSSVVASATPRSTASAVASRITSTVRDFPMVDAQRAVGTRVSETLAALARRDGAALAALAHPTKGVRFSPYPFVRLASDQVLTPAELRDAFASTVTRTWGRTDGRGDPIVLSYGDYHARYVYSRDFIAAKWTAYNHPIGSGNATDNTAEIYPEAILFEAYDPGPDPSLSDTQWQSLRLLFEQSGTAWYLVGVVHGAWTI